MADPARVFLSYSSKDADLVNRLKSALADAGIDVWVDHEQLPPGTPDWRAAVVRGIEQATDVVYAASLDAAESVYVGHELAIARDESKRILPFWMRGEKWSRCAPMGFYYAQYIDGRDGAYAAGLAKLLTTLGVAPTAPTPAVPEQAQGAAKRPAVGPPQRAQESAKKAAGDPLQRALQRTSKQPVAAPPPASPPSLAEQLVRQHSEAKARPNLIPVKAEFGAMDQDKRLLPHTNHSITLQNAGEGMATVITAVLFPSAVYFDEVGRPQGDPPLLGTYWAGRLRIALSPGAKHTVILEEARWPLVGEARITPQYTLYAPAQPSPVAQAGNYYCRAHEHKFNLVSQPPRIAGICDLDGSELYWRADLTPNKAVRPPDAFFSARLTVTCRNAGGATIATVFDLDTGRLARNLDDVWDQVLLPTDVDQSLRQLTDAWANKRQPPRLGG